MDEGSEKSYGNWKGTGNLPMKTVIFFLRIASESEKVFARFFDKVFRGSGFPKISVFRWTIHIELPAKLLDYFLRSNKSNIKNS